MLHIDRCFAGPVQLDISEGTFSRSSSSNSDWCGSDRRGSGSGYMSGSMLRSRSQSLLPITNAPISKSSSSFVSSRRSSRSRSCYRPILGFLAMCMLLGGAYVFTRPSLPTASSADSLPSSDGEAAHRRKAGAIGADADPILDSYHAQQLAEGEDVVLPHHHNLDLDLDPQATLPHHHHHHHHEEEAAAQQAAAAAEDEDTAAQRVHVDHTFQAENDLMYDASIQGAREGTAEQQGEGQQLLAGGDEHDAAAEAAQLEALQQQQLEVAQQHQDHGVHVEYAAQQAAQQQQQYEQEQAAQQAQQQQQHFEQQQQYDAHQHFAAQQAQQLLEAQQAFQAQHAEAAGAAGAAVEGEEVPPPRTLPSLYDSGLSAVDIHGNVIRMADLHGRAAVILNVASHCGYTEPNYKGLQEIYERYHGYGLEILAFPCNQFGQQEPGTHEEIAAFVAEHYAAQFPLMAKVDVNGPEAHPVFQFLKQHTPPLPGHLASEDLSWNFNKFLVDKWGHPVKRYGPDLIQYEIETDVYNELIKSYTADPHHTGAAWAGHQLT